MVRHFHKGTIIMYIEKVHEQLTREIMFKLKLPGSLFYSFIMKRIEWAYMIGFEAGMRNFSGPVAGVVQLTKTGEFIRNFESVTIAARVLEMSTSQICKICIKKVGHKTAHGFKFEYADEYYGKIEVEKELNTTSL